MRIKARFSIWRDRDGVIEAFWHGPVGDRDPSQPDWVIADDPARCGEQGHAQMSNHYTVSFHPSTEYLKVEADPSNLEEEWATIERKDSLYQIVNRSGESYRIAGHDAGAAMNFIDPIRVERVTMESGVPERSLEAEVLATHMNSDGVPFGSSLWMTPGAGVIRIHLDPSRGYIRRASRVFSGREIEIVDVSKQYPDGENHCS